MTRQEKPIGWLHGEIKTPPFSAEARIEAGALLGRLQQGESLGMPLTQKALAEQLKTSQPRVAMMEKGDPSVSLDLIVRALLAMGVKPRKLATVL